MGIRLLDDEPCVEVAWSRATREMSMLPAVVSHWSIGFADDSSDFDEIPVPGDLSRAVPRRRLHFRAGRLCAMRALNALGVDGWAQPVQRGPGGAPLWPAGVTGSITHTDGFAAAAIAPSWAMAALGIDSEGVLSESRARTVAPVVAAPWETGPGLQAGLDAREALTLVFSAKEAVFKGLSTQGERVGFHDVRIVGVDGAACTFEARVRRTPGVGVPSVAPGANEGRATMLVGSFSLRGAIVHTAVVLPEHA